MPFLLSSEVNLSPSSVIAFNLYLCFVQFRNMLHFAFLSFTKSTDYFENNEPCFATMQYKTRLIFHENIDFIIVGGYLGVSWT